MFTASLLTAMLHALWEDPLEFDPPADSLFSARDAFKRLRLVIVERRLPVVGRSDPFRSQEDRQPLWKSFTDLSFHESTRRRGIIFWGRTPVRELVTRYLSLGDERPSVEYIDLGTPVQLCATGFSDDADDVLERLLPKTAAESDARAILAVVDRGVAPRQLPPESYGGRLHYTSPVDLMLADHAKRVIATALQQLSHRGALGQVRIVTSLVPEPPKWIGKDALESDNVVELLSALQALKTYLASQSIPSVTNLSMGTHVGPHNGDTTFEQFVADMFQSPAEGRPARFVSVAAGNDGPGGSYARRDLEPQEPDRVTLLLGLSDVRQIIVEFWWHDAGTTELDLEVDVREASTGKRRYPSSVRLNSRTHGYERFSAQRNGNDLRQSLIATRCVGDLSCMAFALSSRWRTDLDGCQIDFTLKSATATTVHGWIVSSSDKQTTFKTGSSNATLTVPAAARTVLSVAGVDAEGAPWIESSRGPTVSYGSATGDHSPHVAHFVSFGSGNDCRKNFGSENDCGTSYAAARVSADIAATLVHPFIGVRCVDRNALIEQLLGAPPNAWSPRLGYGRIPL